MTLFGCIATSTNPPSLQNKKNVATYTNKIIKICCDESAYTKTFERAVEIIEEIGLRKDRDEVRSATYAHLVKKYCHEKLLVEKK